MKLYRIFKFQQQSSSWEIEFLQMVKKFHSFYDIRNFMPSSLDHVLNLPNSSDSSTFPVFEIHRIIISLVRLDRQSVLFSSVRCGFLSCCLLACIELPALQQWKFVLGAYIFQIVYIGTFRKLFVSADYTINFPFLMALCKGILQLLR